MPLGGLGEIGLNCLALAQGRDVLVVDCGVMFPDRPLGVDVIRPDFGWLLAHRERVRGVVLTHGHEDHIGALPYLLRELDVPVHGPPYALALVRERLQEHALPHPARLIESRPREPFALGSFEVEPVRVTHSMADSTALLLRTAAGTVVHTGDFKLDSAPTDGESFDAERLREAGDEGVRLLLSDSTNACVEGSCGEESEVAAALDRFVGRARGCVVVAIFASNAHRLRALMKVARAHGRRVCLLGRSVERHRRVAVETGYLPDPGALLVGRQEAAALPRRELLVVATGTQGERATALARLAAGRHADLTLEAGDEVILSSRIIPGNELAIFAMIDRLERRGVRVRFGATDPGVHVSGHARRDELRRMIKLVRPDCFMPVHGTRLHLERHAELAREAGVGRVLVAEDGERVELSSEGLRSVDQVETGRVPVGAGGPIPDEVLRDRALLAELGFALVVVQLGAGGAPVGAPLVFTRGVVGEEDEAALVLAARRHVQRDLAGVGSGVDEAALAERARRALARYLGRRPGRKPLIWSVVQPATTGSARGW